MTNSKIIISNSTSQLQNISRSSLNKIRKEITFFDMAKYFKSKSWNYSKTYLIDSEGHFPTGLTKRVFTACSEKGISLDIIDSRLKPPTRYLNLVQRSPEPKAYTDQIQATKSLIESKSGRGIVVLPTGLGKTRVMKDTILELSVNTLVVVPSLNLKVQIYDYLLSCFGEEFVGFFNKEVNNKAISIANLDSLTRCPPELFTFFDCVYFDEWHHEACETARVIDRDLFSDIYYKFAQTATNFRNSKNEQILLDCIMSNQTYSLTPVEAIKKKYITPIKVYYKEIGDIALPDKYLQNDMPWGNIDDDINDRWTKEKEGMHYGKKVYPDWIVNHDERTNYLVKMANDMAHIKKVPTIILVKNISHGEIFERLVKDSVFVNGQLGQEYNHEKIKAFNNLEIPVLIGTSVIGEGVDTKEAGALINASGEKSKTKIMQNAGRVVRISQKRKKEFGYVFDCFDNGHKTTKKHSNIRKRIYQKEFGVKINKID